MRSKTNRAGLTLLAVLIACGARIAPAEDAFDPAFAASAVPTEALEANGRTCVALAVFEVARGASWLEQAVVAQTVANAAAEADAVDACDVLPALLGRPFPYPRPGAGSLLDWQTALAVTDAVLSGDYTVSPPACAGATRFTRAEVPARAGGFSPLAPVCRVGNLSFFATRQPVLEVDASTLAATYEANHEHDSRD